jgi:hypothetical protein
LHTFLIIDAIVRVLTAAIMNKPATVNIEKAVVVPSSLKVTSNEEVFPTDNESSLPMKQNTKQRKSSLKLEGKKDALEVKQIDVDASKADEENTENGKSDIKVGNNVDNLPSPDAEEDEEVRLAMEMAIAAAKNPHLSPAEIQKLVGEKNAQAKMIDEFAKKNEEKIKMNQLKAKEYQRQQSAATSNSWWVAAAKKAEEIKDRAERSLYAEQISKDETIAEIRKTMKILKKTLKAHRLQGNRVETRHVFKRQRMEKRLIQSNDKLKKTQQLFTNSNYNVQEYLKAVMRASKKWRKIGTDDELMLEAQLSRNMHQMLALEKQKVKCKKNTKEMKKYLQRCKGWLSDKKAFCEMNIMTLDATQNSILRLYEETLRRQDRLIAKYKASQEFKSVDLLAVDLSHVTFPAISYIKPEGVTPLAPTESGKEPQSDNAQTSDQATSRQKLLSEYYKQQQEQPPNTPELYVVANQDEASVSSRLSDPDASIHGNDEESEDGEAFGSDAPWHRRRFDSGDNESSDDGDVPSALKMVDIVEPSEKGIPCNIEDVAGNNAITSTDEDLVLPPSEG